MQNAFVPKVRRPKFELQLKIIDLNNVPLVSGTSYIKWHLPASTSADHRGRTPKSVIKEHKVHWDYERTLQFRLTADRNGLLQNFEIHLEVLQEYASGARGERIVLGNVKLNLSEYVDGADDTEEPVIRRYLMQESKINSTLKISLLMKQIDGERNFTAPPLKTAPVFGGIAGIMTSEQGETDDLGHMPSMSSKTREIGQLQDMYRKTLIASWSSQVGELPADECIEDIFSGGDGWGKKKRGDMSKVPSKKAGDSTEDNESEGETVTLRAYSRTSSGYGRQLSERSRGHGRSNSRGDDSTNNTIGVSGRTSIEQQIRSGHPGKRMAANRRMNEVDEIEIREDLRSWEIPTKS